MKDTIGSVPYSFIIIKTIIYLLPLTIFLELDNASGEETSINNDVDSNNKSFAPELVYASLIIKDSNDLQQTTKNYYSDIDNSYDYYSGGLGDWVSLIFSFASNLSIILFFLFLSLSTFFYYLYRFIKIKTELRSKNRIKKYHNIIHYFEQFLLNLKFEK